MEVRIAGPRDIAGIVDVHLRSSSAAYAGLPAAVLAVSAETRRLQWADALESPGSQVRVVAEGPTILGICHLRLPPTDIQAVAPAEIASLYIDPDRWGTGLGRKLVEAARAAAAAAGHLRLTLQVYEANARARAAYEALGFTAEPGTIVHLRSGLPLMTYGMSLEGDPHPEAR